MMGTLGKYVGIWSQIFTDDICVYSKTECLLWLNLRSMSYILFMVTKM